MTQHKLDMGKAWTDAMARLRANRELVGVLAGLFLFLPMFVLSSTVLASDLDMGPPGAQPDPEKVMAQVQAVLASNWWAFVIGIIGPICGEIAILALLGDRTRPTVGEVLAQIPRLFASMFAAQFLVGLVKQAPLFLGAPLVAMLPFGGLVLLIGIGFFLSVRLTLTSAVIVIDKRLNPLAAMLRSWRLTAGNSGVLMVFFAALLSLAVVIALLVIVSTGLIFAAFGERAALFGNAAMLGVMLATYYSVSHALSAAIHRQLSQPAGPEVEASLFD